jgi:hypothetical protein
MHIHLRPEDLGLVSTLDPFPALVLVEVAGSHRGILAFPIMEILPAMKIETISACRLFCGYFPHQMRLIHSNLRI